MRKSTWLGVSFDSHVSVKRIPFVTLPTLERERVPEALSVAYMHGDDL